MSDQSSFHRGIAWGLVFSGPIWLWILLGCYFLGRAA